MVTTRRALPDQPTQSSPALDSSLEAKDKKSAGSPSRKRKALSSQEEPAGKKRHLTPPPEDKENGTGSLEKKANGVASVVAETCGEPADEETGGAASEQECEELDKLSRELLKVFTYTTFDYLTAIVSKPRSRKGKIYRTLYERFQTARQPLPLTDKFILIKDDRKRKPSENTIRRTNMVTFAASMLGSRDASFRQLNEHFLEIFAGRSGRLLKQQAEILLGLKTHAYISQVANEGKLKEDLLAELFPSDMAQKLLALRPDAGHANLVSSEQTFIKQLTNRRRSLSEKATPEAIRSLREKYKWREVLLNMISYLKQHFEEFSQKQPSEIHSMNDDGESQEDVVEEMKLEVPQAATPIPPVEREKASVPPKSESEAEKGQDSTANLAPESEPADLTLSTGTDAPGGEVDNTGDGASFDDILAKAMEAADEVMAGTFELGPTNNTQGAADSMAASSLMAPTTHAPAMPIQYSNPYSTNQQAMPHSMSPYAIPQRMPQSSSPPTQAPVQAVQPPPGVATAAPGGQSHPTHQLYEMARQATTGRSTQPAPRRSGTQSQRRPWTQEEEQALMQGLDQVKGPHWSMILQLYGQGGKISEVLKDRNQVQLKDKARNLKLWFLKSGVEVPVNLKSVTGELKTRAPAAVRNQVAAAAASTGNGVGPSQTHQDQAQHPTPPAGFVAAQSPYGPTVPYAAPASGSTSTASGIAPQLPTAGPQDVHQALIPTANDGSSAPDPWADAAADAAAEAFAELQATMNAVPSGQVAGPALQQLQQDGEQGTVDEQQLPGTSGAPAQLPDTNPLAALAAAQGAPTPSTASAAAGIEAIAMVPGTISPTKSDEQPPAIDDDPIAQAAADAAALISADGGLSFA